MLQLSKSKRSIGTIKAKPEDFIVEEITDNGTVLELGRQYAAETLGMREAEDGRFAVFVMQKTNWNTLQALKAVARRLQHGIKSAGFAGTKDRTSVSTQLCSLFGASPGDVLGTHLKDIRINCAWRGAGKIKLGALLGNRFTIKVAGMSGHGDPDGTLKELGGVFPNYFGGQRFGTRENNVSIGVSMLRGDFERAALDFLTGTGNETNGEAIGARKRLAAELDFKGALLYFPAYLKYERLVIEYLSRFPGDYTNALRRLPRSLSLMFIHSVEAYIFNRVLEERVRDCAPEPKGTDMVCYPNSYGFPDISRVAPFDGSDKEAFVAGNIMGYGTERISEFESGILDGLGITANSFKVVGMNELNSRGTYRVLFAPYKDITYSSDAGGGSATFRFSLPAGSYATVLLNEFVSASAPPP